MHTTAPPCPLPQQAAPRCIPEAIESVPSGTAAVFSDGTAVGTHAHTFEIWPRQKIVARWERGSWSRLIYKADTSRDFGPPHHKEHSSIPQWSLSLKYSLRLFCSLGRRLSRLYLTNEVSHAHVTLTEWSPVACVGRACDAKQLLEREAGQDWLKREPGQDWTKREAGSEWSRRGEADLEKRIVLQCAYGKTCCQSSRCFTFVMHDLTRAGCPNGGKQCMKCVVPGGCSE